MTFFLKTICYYKSGDNMKVKLFDEEDEGDLEDDINDFLNDNIEVIDIKYEVAISIYNEEQVYCFSAMVVYTAK